MRFGAVNTLKHCSQNKVGLNKITFRIIIYSFYNLVHSTVPPPTHDHLKLKYGQVFMNAKIDEDLSLNKTCSSSGTDEKRQLKISYLR